jgi:hypothetical protein
MAIGSLYCPLQASAQFASLNNAELVKLKKLIKNDTMVRQSYQFWKTKAENALNEAPQPVPKINAEGKLAGDPDKIKTNIALRDMQKVYALSLAYQLYNDKKYLNKASEYLKAWATINHSVGDPIDDTNLEDMIAGYDMIRKDINTDDRRLIDKWLQETADAELNSAYTTPGRTNGTSNWNSHRVKIITLITYCLHNKDYEPIVDKEITRQININLFADGSGYDFAARDALHYHVYTLEPLITAATVIYRATGKDYFNSISASGSSIKKSIDFLIPFVTGEKTHAEFVNSKIAFDKARSNNGEKDFQTGVKFDARKGFHVLTQAAYFNKAYADTLQQINGGRYNSLDWQLVLNRVRQPFQGQK